MAQWNGGSYVVKLVLLQNAMIQQNIHFPGKAVALDTNEVSALAKILVCLFRKIKQNIPFAFVLSFIP